MKHQNLDICHPEDAEFRVCAQLPTTDLCIFSNPSRMRMQGFFLGKPFASEGFALRQDDNL